MLSVTSPSPLRRLAVVLTLGVLVAAGCSSDPGDGGTSPAPSATSGTDTPAEEGATSTPAAKPVPRNKLRPDPRKAEADRPQLYADDCQVLQDSDELTDCAYGASPDEATATIAVVGDSKVGQWSTALQRLAETRGWRILIYTKSACAPVTVPMDLDGDEYTTCTSYNEKVRAALVADPVDLILLSNSSDSALLTEPLQPGEDAQQASLDRFVEGEKEAWKILIDGGNRVAVISDIPRPTTDGKPFDLPTCVIDNRDYVDACSFDKAAGTRLSGSVGQLRGIEEMDAVDVTPALFGDEVPAAADAPLVWIDPIQVICPGETCAPADGDILIYREGSHLTDTYITSFADRIGDVMTALGLP